MDIYTERIYYLPAPDDGTGFLVDDIWPRGISKNKEQTRVDGRLRELASSKDLRQWYSHDPSRWEDFEERYFAELDAKHDASSALAETSPSGRVPPLFAARDPLHNNAAAHPEYLLSASTSD